MTFDFDLISIGDDAYNIPYTGRGLFLAVARIAGII